MRQESAGFGEDPFILTQELLERCRAILMLASQVTHEAALEVLPEAEMVEIPGATLKFSGDGSPITGAWLHGGDADVDFGEIERFFRGRASRWELSAGPLVNAATFVKAAEAGYAVEAFEGVLGQYGGGGTELPANVREVGPDNFIFGQVSEAGWTGATELKESLGPITQILYSVKSARYFLAFDEDLPVGAAAFFSFDSGCLLAGGCTRVQWRGRGHQQALIKARLASVPEGQLCIVSGLVGGSSYRNMQRHGFRPLYTELVLRRLE